MTSSEEAPPQSFQCYIFPRKLPPEPNCHKLHKLQCKRGVRQSASNHGEDLSFILYLYLYFVFLRGFVFVAQALMQTGRQAVCQISRWGTFIFILSEIPTASLYSPPFCPCSLTHWNPQFQQPKFSQQPTQWDPFPLIHLCWCTFTINLCSCVQLVVQRNIYAPIKISMNYHGP